MNGILEAEYLIWLQIGSASSSDYFLICLRAVLEILIIILEIQLFFIRCYRVPHGAQLSAFGICSSLFKFLLGTVAAAIPANLLFDGATIFTSASWELGSFASLALC